ncbi:hypothetical protein M405DRAFT_813706, partial [Rhizopogon salebrosus TDB-379]
TVFIVLFCVPLALAWIGSVSAFMSIAGMGSVWLATVILLRLPDPGPSMNRRGLDAMSVLFVGIYGVGITCSALSWVFKVIGLVAGPLVAAVFVWTVGIGRIRGYHLCNNIFIRSLMLAYISIEEDDQQLRLSECGLPAHSSSAYLSVDVDSQW